MSQVTSVSARPRVGVSFTGCRLNLAQIRRLVKRADHLGYPFILVDGDASLLPARPESPIYDSTALLATALNATRRARVGSIRLPAYWNPVLLARSLSTLQAASAGRALALFGVGSGRHEQRLDLPLRSASERVDHLDELLDALRALFSGERISRQGRYVRFCDVSITQPPAPLPIIVSAAGPRALRVVERHADIWDANVPPVPERFIPLREKLGRPIETWIWIFSRPGADLETAIADYRRYSPWFSDLSRDVLTDALLWGDAQRCSERLDTIGRSLGINVAILDFAGLEEQGVWQALEILAPAKAGQIP